MALTADDRALLAAVLGWAAAAGITRRRMSGSDPVWEWTDLARSYEIRLEIVDDESAQLTVDHVARRLYDGWPTTVSQAVDVLAALDVLPCEQSATYMAGVADGHAEAYFGGTTQWGIRRAGRKSVRPTSEARARSLLRNWIVPGEMVRREVGPWEVAATNADLLARREAGGR